MKKKTKRATKAKRLVIDKGDAERVVLRDYFAAMALSGMFSDPNSTAGHRQDFAEKAYQYADAMLAARGNQ